jgi:hypothetical protein
MSPLSSGTKRSLNTQELTPTCTTKKEIRNKPVTATTIFLPIEEVNNWDQFILTEHLDGIFSGRKNKAATPNKQEMF